MGHNESKKSNRHSAQPTHFVAASNLSPEEYNALRTFLLSLAGTTPTDFQRNWNNYFQCPSPLTQALYSKWVVPHLGNEQQIAGSLAQSLSNYLFASPLVKLRTIAKLFSTNEDHITITELRVLIRALCELCYFMVWPSMLESPIEEKFFDPLLSSITGDLHAAVSGVVEIGALAGWIHARFSDFYKPFDAFLYTHFIINPMQTTSTNPATKSTPSASPPVSMRYVPLAELINAEASAILSRVDMWLLSLTLSIPRSSNSLSTTVSASDVPFVRPKWVLLYSSRDHGLSLKSLVSMVTGYHQPSLFVVRTTAGDVFGVYVSPEWVTNPVSLPPSNVFGDRDCFIFLLRPYFRLMHSTGVGTQYVYLYAGRAGAARRVAAAGAPQKPVGIGIGGKEGSFRIWLDEDLKHGTSRAVCSTYEEGAVVSTGDSEAVADGRFTVAAVEIWGVGDVMAGMAGQQREREREVKNVEKARKVDRKMLLGEADWNENPDRLLLEWGGVHTTSHYREAAEKEPPPG